jgi:hypothetical protein
VVLSHVTGVRIPVPVPIINTRSLPAVAVIGRH